MTARYHCYSAIFAQPEGLQLPQHCYRLRSPEGDEWEAMLTPVGPDEEGDRHLLQALFHVKRPRLRSTSCRMSSGIPWTSTRMPPR